jgi:hypothetical protein
MSMAASAIDVSKFHVCGQLHGSSSTLFDAPPIDSLVAQESLFWPNGSTLTVKVSGYAKELSQLSLFFSILNNLHTRRLKSSYSE